MCALLRWRVLGGAWSVGNGAMVGVGAKARSVREGSYPSSYRLRFEVASQGAAAAASPSSRCVKSAREDAK